MNEAAAISKKQLYRRGMILVLVTLCAYFFSSLNKDFQPRQIYAITIFMMIIMSTLMFWKFRLAIAFVGLAALLGSQALDLNSFIEHCELDIILFLVGMMVTVGVLKEIGLFTWIIQLVISKEGMTGKKFIVILVYMSAFLACIVDEVTSIVFIATLIFQVCDAIKVKPTPYIIIAIMATNIGSCGTMLGNPVGILIGTGAQFSFADFLFWSFPLMITILTVILFILMFWYRKDIQILDERLKERRQKGLGLGPLVQVPYLTGLLILIGLIALISSHHFLENALKLEKNTILIVAPLFVAGLLMIWRHERARHYIETEVEWWTLMFFMMLFAVAGSLQTTEVTSYVAKRFAETFTDTGVLTPIIIFLSAIGSAFVDNIVFVAAFKPVVAELNNTALWWGLLFGACFGGNITMIGSTANIVAIGMLEKRYRLHIIFKEWLKIGVIIGIISCFLAWGGTLILSNFSDYDKHSTKSNHVEKPIPEH